MPKFYDRRTLNHDQAVAWAHQQIVQMGFSFTETHVEAGIDAHVELADPGTGAAAACFLGVQVKTQERFSAENEEQFSFHVDGEDLSYWNSSVIPILLLVCKARTSEAYAVFVQEYFKLPENRTRKTVIFNKEQHRFVAGEEWQRRLLQASVPRSRGLAFPPAPSPEELSSNLLETYLPETVYSANTTLKDRRDVMAALERAKSPVREVVVRGQTIWTVHPMNTQAWRTIGRADEPEAFVDFAFHKDPVKRDAARELLNLCLNERLRLEGVIWSVAEEMFIYRPRAGEGRRVRKSVRGDRRETKMGLLHVTPYQGRIVRCRHAAMVAQFRSIGCKYYLQIEPTWYFSRGGWKHPRWEDLIRGIRLMQKEREFHAALRLWREILTQERDLVRGEYPFLRFGNYLRFEAPVSIPDELWRKTSDLSLEAADDQDDLMFSK